MVKRALKAEFLCCFKNMLLLGCITLGGWIFGEAFFITGITCSCRFVD